MVTVLFDLGLRTQVGRREPALRPEVDPANPQRAFQTGWILVGHQRSVDENQNLVGVGTDLFEIVRGEQHGPAAAFGLQRFPKVLTGLDVHPHGGLVQDQQVRIRE